jgi:hypothetical protein
VQKNKKKVLDFLMGRVYNFPTRSMDTMIFLCKCTNCRPGLCATAQTGAPGIFVQVHKREPGAEPKICASAQKIPWGLTNLNARRCGQYRRGIIPHLQGLVNSQFAQISHKNFVHLHKNKDCAFAQSLINYHIKIYYCIYGLSS